ncbi:MAG TPA: helix-turn-helix domain-containing protein [Streptosporangiaceae bacterium]|jgi:hypothetical protein
MAEPVGPAPGGPGEVPDGDLYELADAVADLLDASITIEDRDSRVLAYSRRQDRADRARIETILWRQMPRHYTRQLEEDGFFRKLSRSDRPVYLSGDDTGVRRAAIRVSAGDEILGTIWATVTRPMDPDRERAFMDASRTVALRLLRARAASSARRRHADLLAAVFAGGRDAPDAAARLGLPLCPSCVLALAHRPAAGHGRDGNAGDDADPARWEAERQRIGAAFAAHLTAAHPHAVAAGLGGVTYAVLPSPGGPEAAERAAARAAATFLGRLGDPAVLIGVGRAAATVRDLPASRTDADQALRVLSSGAPGGRQVVRLAEAQAEALVVEMAERLAADGRGPAGPVGALLAHDAAHGTDLAATLRAWLDALGDVNAAAAARHVHPNTIRYRLRKVTALTALDLTDPDQRFAAQLLLRLTAVSGGS